MLLMNACTDGCVRRIKCVQGMHLYLSCLFFDMLSFYLAVYQGRCEARDDYKEDMKERELAERARSRRKEEYLS